MAYLIDCFLCRALSSPEDRKGGIFQRNREQHGRSGCSGSSHNDILKPNDGGFSNTNVLNQVDKTCSLMSTAVVCHFSDGETDACMGGAPSSRFSTADTPLRTPVHGAASPSSSSRASLLAERSSPSGLSPTRLFSTSRRASSATPSTTAWSALNVRPSEHSGLPAWAGQSISCGSGTSASTGDAPTFDPEAEATRGSALQRRPSCSRASGPSLSACRMPARNGPGLSGSGSLHATPRNLRRSRAVSVSGLHPASAPADSGSQGASSSMTDALSGALKTLRRHGTNIGTRDPSDRASLQRVQAGGAPAAPQHIALQRTASEIRQHLLSQMPKRSILKQSSLGPMGRPRPALASSPGTPGTGRLPHQYSPSRLARSSSRGGSVSGPGIGPCHSMHEMRSESTALQGRAWRRSACGVSFQIPAQSSRSACALQEGSGWRLGDAGCAAGQEAPQQEAGGGAKGSPASAAGRSNGGSGGLGGGECEVPASGAVRHLRSASADCATLPDAATADGEIAASPEPCDTAPDAARPSREETQPAAAAGHAVAEPSREGAPHVPPCGSSEAGGLGDVTVTPLAAFRPGSKASATKSQKSDTSCEASLHSGNLPVLLSRCSSPARSVEKESVSAGKSPTPLPPHRVASATEGTSGLRRLPGCWSQGRELGAELRLRAEIAARTEGQELEGEEGEAVQEADGVDDEPECLRVLSMHSYRGLWPEQELNARPDAELCEAEACEGDAAGSPNEGLEEPDGKEGRLPLHAPTPARLTSACLPRAQERGSLLRTGAAEGVPLSAPLTCGASPAPPHAGGGVAVPVSGRASCSGRASSSRARGAGAETEPHCTLTSGCADVDDPSNSAPALADRGGSVAGPPPELLAARRTADAGSSAGLAHGSPADFPRLGLHVALSQSPLGARRPTSPCLPVSPTASSPSVSGPTGRRYRSSSARLLLHTAAARCSATVVPMSLPDPQPAARPSASGSFSPRPALPSLSIPAQPVFGALSPDSDGGGIGDGGESGGGLRALSPRQPSRLGLSRSLFRALSVTTAKAPLPQQSPAQAPSPGGALDAGPASGSQCSAAHTTTAAALTSSTALAPADTAESLATSEKGAAIHVSGARSTRTVSFGHARSVLASTAEADAQFCPRPGTPVAAFFSPPPTPSRAYGRRASACAMSPFLTATHDGGSDGPVAASSALESALATCPIWSDATPEGTGAAGSLSSRQPTGGIARALASGPAGQGSGETSRSGAAAMHGRRQRPTWDSNAAASSPNARVSEAQQHLDTAAVGAPANGLAATRGRTVSHNGTTWAVAARAMAQSLPRSISSLLMRGEHSRRGSVGGRLPDGRSAEVPAGLPGGERRDTPSGARLVAPGVAWGPEPEARPPLLS